MQKFIVDTQLPPVLASFFIRKGYNATHTTDYPKGDLLNDDEIIQIAERENRIIITKDSDFFDKYFLLERSFSTLYLRVGNMKNNDLIDLIQKHLDIIIREFDQGSKLLMLANDQLVAY